MTGVASTTRNSQNQQMYSTHQVKDQSRIGMNDPYTKNTKKYKEDAEQKRKGRRSRKTLDIFKSVDFNLSHERSVDKLNVKAIFRKDQSSNFVDPDAHIKMVTDNTFKKGRFGSHQNNQPFE